MLYSCEKSSEGVGGKGEAIPENTHEATRSGAQVEATTPPESGRGNAGSAIDVSARCGDICRKTETLGCRNQRLCVDGCVQSFGLPVCPRELGNFLSCATKEPVERWVCSPDGVPALRDGSCEAEQQAVVDCFGN